MKMMILQEMAPQKHQEIVTFIKGLRTGDENDYMAMGNMKVSVSLVPFC